MKCKVSQAEFAKALRACEKSLLLKANLPVLANILISIGKNKLEILSTNLETATKVTIPSQTQQEGKTTLPGRVLMEFVSQLPEGTVEFEKLGEEVVLSAKGYSARLATMAPEEFPAIPKIEAGREFAIEAQAFAKCALQIVFCAAQDEGRPILNGVLCEGVKGRLSMVATDGYRLGFVEVPTQSQEKAIKIVIPAKSVGEVAKLISENLDGQEEKTLKMVVAANLNQVNFKVGSIEFTSRLIEGEFPDWQKIIPTSFATKAKIAREEFIRKIKIASIFARDSGSIVRLKLEGKKLTILANTSQVGSNETETEVEITGKGGEIAFNYRYLLEALSAIDSEDVNFEMSESLTPGRLTSTEGQEGFFHIIMPVRLQA